jgi:hypothetical protein
MNNALHTIGLTTIAEYGNNASASSGQVSELRDERRARQVARMAATWMVAVKIQWLEQLAFTRHAL